MRRKVNPLSRLPVTEEEAKAKVSLVIQVLSGEKSISEACRDTGLKPLTYYKLEERLLRGMLLAASMPAARRGRRKDPAAEANQIAAETEDLRQEHRRMQSLVRITRRLFRTAGARNGPKGPRKPRTPAPASATSE